MDFDESGRFAGDGVAGPVRFSEVYELKPGSGDHTTRLHYEVVATPRGPFKLITGPLGRQLRTLLDGDLGRFKRLLEGLDAA
jgi:hypothetical protein